MKPTFIGIAGGTGSGKTHLSKLLLKEFGRKNIARIELDSYYKNNSKLSLIERGQLNYDHPNTLDLQLIREQLQQLNNGKVIKIPNYNFKTHLRMSSKNKLIPKKIIIIEGIFALYFQDIYKFLDIKIFLNTAPDIRFIRRLKRDIKCRGRSVNSVIKQYLNSVRPMYTRYIKPTKILADIVVEDDHDFYKLSEKINSMVIRKYEDKKT